MYHNHEVLDTLTESLRQCLRIRLEYPELQELCNENIMLLQEAIKNEYKWFNTVEGIERRHNESLGV